MYMSVEERIAALETELAEIKKLKGIPGARGPAGPIEAAVANANRVVADAESRVRTEATGAYANFNADVRKLREEVREEVNQVKQFLDERIQNVVENHTVKVLEDYGVVSDFDGKRITTK